VDLKDIKAIVDLMKKNALTEFELEHQDFKIKLKRGLGAPASADEPPTYTPPPVVAAPAAASAPSPESDDYVEIGTEVNPETVVCIIEAMKVMNEIKAEAKGVVTHILVESGKPVEFGQPLFRIRPT